MKVKCTLSNKKFVTNWKLLGGPLVCILECLVKASFCVKGIPHVWHRYGFSPVRVCTWLSKFGYFVKTFPNTVQMCASPVCNLGCWFKSNLHLNILPHRPQWYVRSTVCILLCFSRLPSWINCRPQTEHCYCFSPVCIFMCTFNFCTHFPHTAQCWRFEG